MGKYMKKSKITSEVSVMEVSQPISLGVRTRAAKTLALQRLNSNFASASPAVAMKKDASAPAPGSSCYLQLRSRRLEKPPLLTETEKRHKPKTHKSEDEVGGSYRAASRSRLRVGSESSGSAGVGDDCFGNNGDFAGGDGNCENKVFCETEEGNDVGVEASFGENNLDFESGERSTRESTPSNLIRDPDIICTPGSTTRRMSSSALDYRRGLEDTQRIVPTTHELEEFFAYAEQKQQRVFMEKYNFDIVNDMPLAGRYEWVQVAP